MLSISTLPEALSYLTKHTGRTWTDSELLDAAVKYAIELHAPVPMTAETTVQVFEPRKGLIEKYRLGPNHSVLAVLFNFQVGQLLICGETQTSHPHDHDRIEGEYKFLTEPIRVTRSDVRVRAESLRQILKAWNDAQTPDKHPALYLAWMLPQAGTVQHPNAISPEELNSLPTENNPSEELKQPGRGVVHKIKNRTQPLDAEISQAKKLALDERDPTSVWAELIKMAEQKIGCLLGVDGKDIKYQSGEKVEFFRKRSLNERMNRIKPR